MSNHQQYPNHPPFEGGPKFQPAPQPKKRSAGKTVAIVVGSIVGGLVVLGVIGSVLPDNSVQTSDAPLPNVVSTTADTGPSPDPVVTPTNKPAPAPKTTAPKPTTPAKPRLSVGQEQAIESAESYIDSGDFSRKGLIEQLKFEGFTTKEAAYAVDHITVNWTAEADDSAASYLESGSFSRKSLMDQLLYEGFTKAQAAHAVKSVGL